MYLASKVALTFFVFSLKLAVRGFVSRTGQRPTSKDPMTFTRKYIEDTLGALILLVFLSQLQTFMVDVHTAQAKYL